MPKREPDAIDSPPPPDAADSAPLPEATEPAPLSVKARVLTACAYGQANDIAMLDPALAAQGAADGVLDTHPDAVAYAEQLLAGAV